MEVCSEIFQRHSPSKEAYLAPMPRAIQKDYQSLVYLAALVAALALAPPLPSTYQTRQKLLVQPGLTSLSTLTQQQKLVCASLRAVRDTLALYGCETRAANRSPEIKEATRSFSERKAIKPNSATYQTRIDPPGVLHRRPLI